MMPGSLTSGSGGLYPPMLSCTVINNISTSLLQNLCQHSLGLTQFICCFSDPDVHSSLKKIGKNTGNRIFSFFKNHKCFYVLNLHAIFYFFFPFIYIIIPIDPLNGSGKYPRNNKSFKSGLTLKWSIKFLILYTEYYFSLVSNFSIYWLLSLLNTVLHEIFTLFTNP